MAFIVTFALSSWQSGLWRSQTPTGPNMAQSQVARVPAPQQHPLTSRMARVRPHWLAAIAQAPAAAPPPAPVTADTPTPPPLPAMPVEDAQGQPRDPPDEAYAAPSQRGGERASARMH